MASTLRTSPADCPAPVGRETRAAPADGPCLGTVPGRGGNPQGCLRECRRWTGVRSTTCAGSPRSTTSSRRASGASRSSTSRCASCARGPRRSSRSSQRTTRPSDARDEERRELARRAVARAEDHLSVAEIALGRASTDAAQLEREAADWQRELPLLEDRARQLSADLRDVEAPGSGAPALIAWASHAHASLFVAVRQLEAERERVIREANELASALVGEPTYGSTPAQALARVEHG